MSSGKHPLQQIPTKQNGPLSGNGGSKPGFSLGVVMPDQKGKKVTLVEEQPPTEFWRPSQGGTSGKAHSGGQHDQHTKAFNEAVGKATGTTMQKYTRKRGDGKKQRVRYLSTS